MICRVMMLGLTMTEMLFTAMTMIKSIWIQQVKRSWWTQVENVRTTRSSLLTY